MAIRPIVTFNEELTDRAVLVQPTMLVRRDADLDVLDELITDLQDTLLAHPICVGLSANQIGIPLAVSIVHVDRDADEDLEVIVNPAIIENTGKKDRKFESCMSEPSVRGIVERRQNLTVKHLDQLLEERVTSHSGFRARAWLHEIDHLGGVGYMSRMPDGLALEATDSFGYDPPKSIEYTEAEKSRLTAGLADAKLNSCCG